METIEFQRPQMGSFEEVVLRNAGRPLRRWQEEAMQAWDKNSHVGIVEAVTGSGKSLIGILAAAKALDAGMAVVVVVPKKVLQEQWIQELNKHFKRPGLVGGLGGEYGSLTYSRATRPKPGKIVVAVVNTFAMNKHLHPVEGTKTLIIADEVHNYSSQLFREVLNPSFDWRLGLTATLEVQNLKYFVLRNYFGKEPVYKYSYKRALEDGTVSRFDVLLLRVEMPSEHLARYYALSERAKSLRNSIILKTGISFDAEKVQQELNQLKEDGKCIFEISEWEDTMDKIDEVLISSESKALAVSQISRLVAERGNTIVFSDSVARAEQTQDIFEERGVRSAIIKAAVPNSTRQMYLRQLKFNLIKAVISPKALDEGVNIESLSVGLFVGVRRHRLQLIQRLGRVLRIEKNKPKPLIIIPVNKSTWEDPYVQGNSRLEYSPLHLIVGLADNIDIFDASDRTSIQEFIEAA